MADDVVMYGLFASDGGPLGFYPTDIYPPEADGSINAKIPAGAIEISHADWQMLVQKQPFAYYDFDSGTVMIGEQPTPSSRAELARASVVVARSKQK